MPNVGVLSLLLGSQSILLQYLVHLIQGLVILIHCATLKQFESPLLIDQDLIEEFLFPQFSIFRLRGFLFK